jgi:hypothetical protein
VRLSIVICRFLMASAGVSVAFPFSRYVAEAYLSLGSCYR